MSKYEDFIPESVTNKTEQNEPIYELDIVPEETVLGDQKMVTDADGNVEIELQDGDTEIEIAVESSFDDNLVNLLDQDEVDDIAISLVGKYEEDRESRGKKRDEQYNEGLRRAGLDEEATVGGADFEGASRVVHPMIAENCINFAAREVKELAPPNGPVKTKIIGKANIEKIEISQQKVDFMNLQLTQYMPYRDTLEKMLSQLAMAGSQFIKFWYDDYLKRPSCEFIPLDMVFIPFECNDFYTAERVTLRTTLGKVEYWRRCKASIYIDDEYLDDIEEGVGSQLTNSAKDTKTERTNNLIEGKEAQNPTDSQDAVDLLEIYAYLMIESDTETLGQYAPYIVTIKEETEEVVAIYRNWHRDDVKRFKLDYLVKFDFIPWRGAYALGLAQIIGSLSVAATGALRSLLDSAFVNNIPTALADKGLKMAGQSPDIQVGGLTFIEGNVGGTGKLSDRIMALPFNPPSQTLFDLLNWLTQSAAKVVQMPDGALDMMGDRTPATTALASIEQSSMTQSAIHQRLHFAQAKCFEIVARLNADYFDPGGYPDQIIEDLQINRELFEDTTDIVPVSDPNIFTEIQRYKQVEMIMGLRQNFPGMINDSELLKRSLVMAKVPDPELLLNVPMQAARANAVAENMAVSLGQAIAVFPDQDHLAHFRDHATFRQDPLFGQNPMFAPMMPNLDQHMLEHLVYAYASAYQTLADEKQVDTMIISKNDVGEFDRELVEFTPVVLQDLHNKFDQYGPLLQKIMQQQQQAQQTAMANNPDMAKIAVEKEKIQSEQQIAQMDNQLDQQKMQGEMQMAQAELQSDQQVKQMEAQIDQIETQGNLATVQTEMMMNQESDQAKMAIERMKVAVDELNALTAIQSENSALEWEQWAAVKEQIKKIDELSKQIMK